MEMSVADCPSGWVVPRTGHGGGTFSHRENVAQMNEKSPSLTVMCLLGIQRCPQTIMTREEFDQMVERLELRYHNRGRALTRAAVLWAVMGYAVLVLGIVLSLGVVLLCGAMIFMAPSAITIKLGLVFGISGAVVAWSILRGSWIRLSPPEGMIIVPNQAPSLFEMIEATSARVGGIRFHRVLLTGDLNACVVQVPRLGVFGWYQNYLCLGIQLMDALAPEEFHAVLAHEFAHLSKAHGRTGNWLYRIRRTWENVATSLSNQGGLLVRPLASFFSWFWPRFNARAFVLSRNNEYEADAFSAEITSPETASSALARIAVEGERIDKEFWETLNQRSVREEQPPGAIFDELACLLKTRIEATNASRWLEHQLARTTDTSDTHPALKDRIAALKPGQTPSSIEPIQESASDALFGVSLAGEIRADFNRKWLEAHGEIWSESHENSRKLREQLAELESSEESPHSEWEKLRIQCNLQGIPAMAAELASFLRDHPHHQIARFILGSHLLSIDDSSGIAMLEEVVKAAPHSAFECFNNLATYHDRHGNPEAIRELKRRADSHEIKMNQAAVERSNISSTDHFEVHDLTEGEVTGVSRVLEGIKELQEASLALKQVRYMPEWKGYVMVVKLKFPALHLVTEATKQQVLQQIVNVVEVDGYLVVLNEELNHKPIAKRIRSIPGTLVYSRK